MSEVMNELTTEVFVQQPLVDVTHDGLGPLPGQGGPVVKYHLVLLAGPWGAGQPVAPQILTGLLHLTPPPG